jgi:hypothetical protein
MKKKNDNYARMHKMNIIKDIIKGRIVKVDGQWTIVPNGDSPN